jgi:hypothetical protein
MEAASGSQTNPYPTYTLVDLCRSVRAGDLDEHVVADSIPGFTAKLRLYDLLALAAPVAGPLATALNYNRDYDEQYFCTDDDLYPSAATHIISLLPDAESNVTFTCWSRFLETRGFPPAKQQTSIFATSSTPSSIPRKLTFTHQSNRTTTQPADRTRAQTLSEQRPTRAREEIPLRDRIGKASTPRDHPYRR